MKLKMQTFVQKSCKKYSFKVLWSNEYLSEKIKEQTANIKQSISFANFQVNNEIEQLEIIGDFLQSYFVEFQENYIKTQVNSHIWSRNLIIFVG